MEQQQQKNNAGNGFVLGVIVGVLIALLFTTKKGRAILRDLSEKGIDKLSNLEQLAKQAGDPELFDEFDEEESDYIKPEPAPAKTAAASRPAPKEEPVVEPQDEPEEEEESLPKPAPKPVAKPVAVKPKVVEEEPEQAVEPEKVEEPHEKAHTKVIQGRRWFRGLKKKG